MKVLVSFWRGSIS